MNQRTRIKICGLTRAADVDAAVEAGADAIGFVFYASSARHIGLSQAAVFAALHFLMRHGGLVPHVRDVRAWALAAPLLVVVATVTYARPRR